jgi:hypothetical protein
MMNRKRFLLALPLLVVALGAGSCDGEQSAVDADRAITNSQLERYQANQPVPAYDWSQYRQTVIDVETAQVHGVATTTFFFNQGVDNPVKVCPSIGFPVATTSQLTNPDQVIYAANGNVTVGQMEPTGVYTGDSTGTYVVCVSDKGTKYVTYWEGFVYTEGGPARWDREQGLAVLEGAPTVESTKQ